MSFRKLSLSVATVAVLTLFGVQASGADPGSADIAGDGKITASEVRDFIVDAVGATENRGMTPEYAGINVGINYKKDGGFRTAQARIRSGSCERGNDWKTYWTNTDFTRGTLCNGKVVLHPAPNRDRNYFQRTMQDILKRILLEGDLTYSGPGLVTSINANSKKASVYFQKYNKAGKMTDTYLAIRIEGSEVTVKEFGPGK